MVNRERVLSTFLDLVQVDGPSGQEDQIAAEVGRRLVELGCEVSADAFGNVIGRLPGRGRTLMLNAHLDCVQPCLGIRPQVVDDVIRSDGSTVLGADDRAGVAVILEVLASLRESSQPHVPLEIVATRSEETGLVGAKRLDYSMLTATWGLAMDDGGPVGACVVSTPWHDVIHAAVVGRAAHSGIAPEKGVSAILVAARAIAAMPLGRIDAETTANIGTIQGGSAMNIVAARAEVTGEARSRDPEKLAAQTERMVRAFRTEAQSAGAQVEVTVERAYDGFNFSADEPIVLQFMNAAKKVGIVPRMESTGGGSDANIFFAHGIPVLNLSAGYEDPHTSAESLRVSDLVLLAGLVEAMVTN